LNKEKTSALFEHFSLDADTILFTGHALALHYDDGYLNQASRETVEKCKLYAYSVSRYGNSPYIYPVYGLGGLPEGFSRLGAIHGATFMLNTPIEEVMFDKGGVVTGIKSGGKVARCKKLIGDPSYFLGTDKIKKTGVIVRSICILSHPVADTNNADSCQIIIPGAALKRKNDVYISVVSYHHQVAAKGKYVAVVSTMAETKEPAKEIEPAVKLLGKVDQQFQWASDQYEPANESGKDQCYITASYDASTHFELATNEVITLYQKLLNKPLDLTVTVDPEDLDPANQQEDPPAKEDPKTAATSSSSSSASSAPPAAAAANAAAPAAAAAAAAAAANAPAPPQQQQAAAAQVQASAPAAPGGPATK